MCKGLRAVERWRNSRLVRLEESEGRREEVVGDKVGVYGRGLGRGWSERTPLAAGLRGGGL